MDVNSDALLERDRYMDQEFDYAKVNTKLMKLFHRMRKITAFSIKEYSVAELQSLQIIKRYMQEYPQEQGIYVSELALKMNTAPSAVSRMLRNLEKKELIGRSVDVKDRRNTNVYLTDKGSIQLMEMNQKMEVYMKKVVKAMGEREMLQLIGLFSKLIGVMEEELAE